MAPSPGLGVVEQLVVGSSHNCVRLDDGGVRCWGQQNNNGVLGYGNNVTVGDDLGEIPSPLVDLGGPVVHLAAAHGHNCAILQTGQVRCWGNNSSGALGVGHEDHVGDDPGEMPPVDTLLGPEPVIQIAAGSGFNCALLEGGIVRCWGGGGSGRLGYGNFIDVGDLPGEMPPANVDVGGAVVQLVAGQSHVCARLVGGNVRCWGDGASGKLGTGNTNDIGDGPGEMPPPDVNLGGPAVELYAGWVNTCARMMDGTLRCWGDSGWGMLGFGSSSNDIGDEPGEMPPQPTPLW